MTTQWLKGKPVFCRVSLRVIKKTEKKHFMISGKFSRIYTFFILAGCCHLLTISEANAQMSRAAQANNITSNIYQNSSHAITGSALQQVMLNQNNSYVNLLSDTNLLDVRIFSPYATYTPGMGVFYQDTLYMNILAAHGSWNSADWVKINGSSCACSILMKYDDTVGGSGISKIATAHSVAGAIAGISLTGAVTGSMSTGGTSGINTTLSNSVVGITNLSATGTPSASNYLRGDNTWATLTNYLSDTSGGSGSKPTILTQNSGWATGGNNVGTSAAIGTLNDEPFKGIADDSISLLIDPIRINTTLGYEAMGLITHSSTMTGNVAIGRKAGGDCTGNYNVCIGSAAGLSLNNSSGDIIIGAGAGEQLENSNSIICIGGMNNNPNLFTNDDIAIGFTSGYNLNIGFSGASQWCTYVGDSTGFSNVTGSHQWAFGHRAGYHGGSYNWCGAIGDTSAFLGNYWVNWGGGSVQHNAFNGDFRFMNDATFYVKNTYSGIIDNASGNTGLGCGIFNGGSATGTDNTVLGYNSGLGLTSGSNNVFLGYEAGQRIQSSTQIVAIGSGAMGNSGGGATNIAIGWAALYNHSGNGNTGIGYDVLYGNNGPSSSGANTAIGTSTLYNNLTGGSNTAVGAFTLYGETSGGENAAMGDSALSFLTTGGYNTAVGNHSGISQVIGNYDIYLGWNAGISNTSLSRFVYLGDTGTAIDAPVGLKTLAAIMPYYNNNYQWGTAGQALVSGGSNSNNQYLTVVRATDTLGGSTKMIGTNNTQVLTNYSGWSTTGNAGTAPGTNFIGTTDNEDIMFKRWDTTVYILSGNKNTFQIAIGMGALTTNYSTLSATTGINNIAIGRSALHQTTTGSYNVALGYTAGGSNTTGTSNIYIGTSAGGSLENGANYNICLGYETADNVPLQGQASYNFLGGVAAGYNLNNGRRNIFIGDTAGFNTGNGNNNIAIGMGAGKNGTTYTNAQAYGYFTSFLGSNTAVLNDSLTLLAQSYGFFRIRQPQSGAGAGLVLPIQQSSATSGTIVSNGAQILELTGSTSSTLQITEPSSPYTGQQFEIITNQSSLSLSFTNGSNFYVTPSSVTNVQSHSFIYDGAKWVMRY